MIEHHSPIDFALNNTEHFMLMFARVPDRPPVDYADVAGDETYGILLGAVQAAIEEGFVQVQPQFNRDDIAYGLWSLAHGLAVMQLTNLSNIDYDFAQADRGVLQTFVRGLAVA